MKKLIALLCVLTLLLTLALAAGCDGDTKKKKDKKDDEKTFECELCEKEAEGEEFEIEKDGEKLTVCEDCYEDNKPEPEPTPDPEPTPEPTPDPEPTPKPTPNPGTVTTNGAASAEAAAKTFFSALYGGGKADDIVNILCQIGKNQILEKENGEQATDAEVKEVMEPAIEMIKQMGVAVTIDNLAVTENTADAEIIAGVLDEMEIYYTDAQLAEITELAEVECTMTASIEGESETETISVICAKIGGSWFVLDGED